MGTSGSQVHHVEEAAAEPGEAASKPSASAPATPNLFICAVPPKRLPTANPHPNGITTPVGARLVAPLRTSYVVGSRTDQCRALRGQETIGSCLQPAPWSRSKNGTSASSGSGRRYRRRETPWCPSHFLSPPCKSGTRRARPGLAWPPPPPPAWWCFPAA